MSSTSEEWEKTLQDKIDYAATQDAHSPDGDEFYAGYLAALCWVKTLEHPAEELLSDTRNEAAEMASRH